MKKQAKKLTLNKDTLRNLAGPDMDQVIGGRPLQTHEFASCTSNTCLPSYTCNIYCLG